MDDSSRQPVYEFEGFRLDSQRRVLFGPDGQALSLPPRLLDALLHFIEYNGQLLTKEHLLDALWPNVVVEEHNLNKTISALRQALGEKPGDNRFLATVPGKGYRFVASVRRVDACGHGEAVSEGAVIPEEHRDAHASLRRRVRPGVVWGLIVALAIGLLLAELYDRTVKIDALVNGQRDVAEKMATALDVLLDGDDRDALLETPEFRGIDPGADRDDPRPNSERAAAAFDEAARNLGELKIITFEGLRRGPFRSLQVASGVTVTQVGTTMEGGIVNGCFLQCTSSVRRGYNVTPSGEQYLGVALIFRIGEATVDFSFDPPIRAFGAYVIGLGTANGDLAIEFDDGTPRSIFVSGDEWGGPQFVGFTAPHSSIKHVTLALTHVVGDSRDNFSVDDVRYTPVPPTQRSSK